MHQGLCQSQAVDSKRDSQRYFELYSGQSECLLLDSAEKQITLKDVNLQRNNNKVFAFDDVFPPQTSQAGIFETASKNLTK